MNIKIKKASGIVEDFDSAKLLNSLIRSGADRDKAEEIISKVLPDVTPYSSTRKIYRLAHKYLRQFNRSSVLRYSLKKAMMRLGPTGYPFEKYIGELLVHYGYEVEVGVVLEGKCVKHEVDVFARRGKDILLIECKFRNSAESSPDVKIAMYVHSRFRDLRTAMKSIYPGSHMAGWLVTNTRFTTDAIQYARCSGLTLKSWRCPEKGSLEQMIEERKLYPVTVMSGLTGAHLRKLFEHNIILMKDLAKMELPEIKRLLSITEKRAANLKEAADKLCFC
jgi:hypothetical protein